MANPSEGQTSLMQRRNPIRHPWVLLGLLSFPTAIGFESPGYASEGLPVPSAPAATLPSWPTAEPANDPVSTNAAADDEANNQFVSGAATESHGQISETDLLHPLPPDLVAAPPLVPGTYLTQAAALIDDPLPLAPLLKAPPAAAFVAQAEDSAEAEIEALPIDPELGAVQVRGLFTDNDLGILRIRDQPVIPSLQQPPKPKFGFLLARMAIASSDNILLAVNDVGGLTGDTFLRPSVGLAVYPSLGPQTAFIATAELGLQRYVSQSALNYDDLRFRVGLRQGLSPRSYGQLILGYQQLFRPGANRSQFFKNTSLGLTLGRRDPLAPNLTLDSYYLAQFNGAQSRSSNTLTDFSRFFQSAGAYLGYDITPQLQVGASYQLNFIDYTSQDRYDTFQQVLGQVAYRITPAVRLSIYGGVSFGRSSTPQVQFNDTFFGAALEATVPLF